MQNFRLKSLILLILPSFIVCCTVFHTDTNDKRNTHSSSKSVDPLTPLKSEVKIARQYWTATTFEKLNEGFTIYNSHCYECHDDKVIQDYDLEAWQVIMRKMGRKAKLVDTVQYNLVYHYILTKREAILTARK